jgi:hypothetical protein
VTVIIGIVEAMRRRELIALTSAVFTRLHAETAGRYRLIAHRGGIVDESHAENSPGSIEAAIKRGYWMLEVDIRRTRDGEPILHTIRHSNASTAMNAAFKTLLGTKCSASGPDRAIQVPFTSRIFAGCVKERFA